jgi:hypothetical protein
MRGDDLFSYYRLDGVLITNMPQLGMKRREYRNLQDFPLGLDAQ